MPNITPSEDRTVETVHVPNNPTLTGGKPGGGSEDFAFVSHEVPTVSMFLAAGNAKEGYTYGQHHPKVRFDDSILYRGTAAYTYMALRWLAEHQ